MVLAEMVEFSGVEVLERSAKASIQVGKFCRVGGFCRVKNAALGKFCRGGILESRTTVAGF